MLSQIIDELEAAGLPNVAPLYRNLRELETNNLTSVPSLFVWDRLKVSAEAAMASQGRNPRHRQDDAHESVVHCWGATEDDCESMRAALLALVREVLAGRSYRVGDADWTYPEWAPSGYVLSQRIVLVLPLVDHVGPTAAAAYQIPQDDVTRDHIPTREVVAVGFDADDAADGDHVLEAGETPAPITQGFSSGFSGGFGKP